VLGEQEHESNEREPPPRKPLVSRILCAFKCQYRRFTRPKKNGETENQKRLVSQTGRAADDGTLSADVGAPHSHKSATNASN
jgi:hypothetical protein